MTTVGARSRAVLEELKRAGRRARSDGAKATLAVLRRALGSDKATALDVYFAYRLLLGREPDAEGFAHHLERLRLLELKPQELAVDFLSSDEAKAALEPTVAEPVNDARVHCSAGFDLFVDPRDAVVGGRLRERGEYEPAVARAVIGLLDVGDCFVDVGANVGYFTLLAARQVGDKGRVIAVEPLAACAARLERSLELNGAANVELHRVAAGDVEGTVRMRQLDARNGGSGALSADGDEVRMQRLDDIIGTRPVALIKLDVEGAEGVALDGLEATLSRSRPALLLEYTPSRLPHVSRRDGPALLRALAARGYALQRVEQLGRPAPRLEALLEDLKRDERGHADLLARATGGAVRGG